MLYERGDLDRCVKDNEQLQLRYPRDEHLLGDFNFVFLSCRYPMAMGTLADLEDQEPIGKGDPLSIHLKVLGFEL